MALCHVTTYACTHRYNNKLRFVKYNIDANNRWTDRKKGGGGKKKKEMNRQIKGNVINGHHYAFIQSIVIALPCICIYIWLEEINKCHRFCLLRRSIPWLVKFLVHCFSFTDFNPFIVLRQNCKEDSRESKKKKKKLETFEKFAKN